MPTLHVQLRGRVQGVGFRWFVRQRARALDLAGWVRNCSDGSVEVAAEGAADALDHLRRELARGPDGAVVQTVTELGSPPSELERPFQMRR